MQIDTFKSIISTFADPGIDLIFDNQRVMFSINGDLIDAKITSDYGDIYVDDGSGRTPASKWIVKNLAKLNLLSARILEQIPDLPNVVSPAADFLPTLESSPN